MKESKSAELEKWGARKIQVLVLLREEGKADRWMEFSPADTLFLLLWLMTKGLIIQAMKGGSYGSNKGSSGPNSGLLNQKSP